jgi:Flp pilus assembly protein TadG
MSEIMPPRPNPYVGPRAFQRGEALFGRDHEVLRLLDLLLAERIVLLYSPSGAGKTSLVEAALTPKLEGRRFRVLPTMRVSLAPAETLPPSANRYVLSLLLSLEENLPPEQQTPLAKLASLTLAEYLDLQSAAGEEPDRIALVFDQFEEILTLNPADRAAKAEFFAQVGEALDDHRRWALFAMREEFVAGLDPHLNALPTRLSTRYRLELLGLEAAKEAMQKPARIAGVEFTDSAADKLARDLASVRVQQPDGRIQAVAGNYVEPVQLQVVCLRLWDGPRDGDAEIGEDDAKKVGDVDAALRGYYTDSVAAVADQTGVPELAIREWFDRQLITEQGIRGPVLLGPVRSQGLENQAIWPLVDAHLVRAEKRRGATWFELAHDRLLEPVRTDNAAWREAHLSPLGRQAILWKEHGKQAGLLLRGRVLAEVKAWAAVHGSELTDVDQEFLMACRREENRTRLIASLVGVVLIVGVVAIGLGILAWRQAEQVLSEAAARAAAEQQARDSQATVSALLEAVLTLQPPAATATPSLIVSRPTPGSVTETPGPFPTPTATPTPNRAATAAAEATLQAVAMVFGQVQATQTAAAIQPLPGDALTQMTYDALDEYVPGLSPDQRTLLVESNRSGNWHIWAADPMDPDGSNWRQLTSTGLANYHARYSPDGTRIVFSSNMSGDRDIYTMAPDGSDMRQLTDALGDDSYPSYSGDGTVIVFMSKRSGNLGVYAMQADGSEQRVVIDTVHDEVFPFVSPDGQRVAFQSTAAGNWEIYVVPLSGGEPQRLTAGRARDAGPVFSPDGRSIVFETNRDGNYEIYVMNRDGSNQQRLTNSPAADQVPSVSPDGQWVLFQSNRNGNWDIYRVPLSR